MLNTQCSMARDVMSLDVSFSFILAMITYLTPPSSAHVLSSSACPQLCNNNGNCIRENDVLSCRCHEGWSGNACTQPCDRRCIYGKCHIVGHSPVCMCPLGFYGDNCQHKNRETSFLHMAKLLSQIMWDKALHLVQNPRQKLEEMIQNGSSDCSSTFQCQNGGKCRHGEFGGYRCQCASSKYTGDFCQFICPRTCLHEGKCIRIRKSSNATTSADDLSLPESHVQYGCACPKDFSGRICQRKRIRDSELTTDYLR